MLTYSFSEIGSDSLYMHLYKCIKEDICNGALAPNCKLPSKRSFAKNLGVSNITVENAYALLQSEGYIYSIPKKGFYVADISFISVGVRPVRKVISPPVIEEKSYIADFVSNRTIPENFPFSVWAKILRETISQNSNELMNIAPCNGIYELRLAIADHLRAFKNIEVSPNQIIVGAGTDYLYSLLVQLLGPKHIYAIENPGYSKIAKVYAAHNIPYRYVSIDRSGIRIDELERVEADIAHISPAHHYPTGIVTPIGRRYELLGWASKKDDRYIIEDDYDSEFRMVGKVIPPLQSIDVMDKVIYINTFTKSLASTMRISYMVLPLPLMEKYYRQLAFYSNTVSTFEQYTLARFINDGYFEKHINRMRNYYRAIRDELLRTINKSPLAKSATVHEEEAGLHFLLELKTEIPDRALIEEASRSGVRISFLSQYDYAPSSKEHVMVMNYSGVRKESIKPAIKILSRLLAGSDRLPHHTSD